LQDVLSGVVRAPCWSGLNHLANPLAGVSAAAQDYDRPAAARLQPHPIIFKILRPEKILCEIFHGFLARACISSIPLVNDALREYRR
jgi:hypothetical protein